MSINSSRVLFMLSCARTSYTPACDTIPSPPACGQWTAAPPQDRRDLAPGRPAIVTAQDRITALPSSLTSVEAHSCDQGRILRPMESLAPCPRARPPPYPALRSRSTTLLRSDPKPVTGQRESSGPRGWQRMCRLQKWPVSIARFRCDHHTSTPADGESTMTRSRIRAAIAVLIAAIALAALPFALGAAHSAASSSSSPSIFRIP